MSLFRYDFARNPKILHKLKHREVEGKNRCEKPRVYRFPERPKPQRMDGSNPRLSIDPCRHLSSWTHPRTRSGGININNLTSVANKGETERIRFARFDTDRFRSELMCGFAWSNRTGPVRGNGGSKTSVFIGLDSLGSGGKT